MSEEYSVLADASDYADMSRVTVDSDSYRSYDSRGQLLSDVLDTVVSSERVGRWDGTVVFCYTAGDYLWLCRDHFGSCSVCDGFIASETEDAYRQYAETLLSNSYAFESKQDAHDFIDHQSGDALYGWGEVAGEAHDLVDAADF